VSSRRYRPQRTARSGRPAACRGAREVIRAWRSHVAPPSMVRRMVPLSPTAVAVCASMTPTSNRSAPVPLVCSIADLYVVNWRVVNELTAPPRSARVSPGLEFFPRAGGPPHRMVSLTSSSIRNRRAPYPVAVHSRQWRVE
jgi:hypothetical protein